MSNDASVARSGAQWTIEADGKQAVLVEVGGGLRTYTVDGHDIVDGYGVDEIAPAGAGQILAPWPNRIRDGQYAFEGEQHQLAVTEPAHHTAIHGLVNWSRWTQVEKSADSVTCEFDLPPQLGYPFALRLRTRWSIDADGLRADHEVTNTGDRNAPWGFSVHPYFQLPGTVVDDLTLHLPAGTRVLTDGRNLPIGAAKIANTEFDFSEPRRIGAAVLDVTFGDIPLRADGTSEVVLAAPSGRSVTVWADGAFRWWQVFTGDTLGGERHRRAVALEPMTCPPDAFRSGRDLLVLAPGETWRAAWGVRTAGA
ncbi:MAG TPA: aldose 1-epimerase family protein [Actinoplanes sp.]|nr:aldose 1-epimerase family protein [Actinoplanes sp.]